MAKERSNRCLVGLRFMFSVCYVEILHKVLNLIMIIKLIELLNSLILAVNRLVFESFF